VTSSACIATENQRKEFYHLGSSIYRELGIEIIDSISPTLELGRDARTKIISRKPILQLNPTLWVID
jgi:hypothetical protein